MSRRCSQTLRSCRASGCRQLGRTLAAGLVAVLSVVGCRPAATPAKDALQDAFREGGLSAVQARGHRIFLQRCATCHGAQGRGDGQNAYNLDPPPPDFEQSLAKLSVPDRRKVVEHGTASLGRSPLCPPWGRSLGADEVDALVAWLDVAARPVPDAPVPTARARR